MFRAPSHWLAHASLLPILVFTLSSVVWTQLPPKPPVAAEKPEQDEKQDVDQDSDNAKQGDDDAAEADERPERPERPERGARGDERGRGDERRRGRDRGRGPRGFGRMLEMFPLFRELDRDSDGTLSPDEIKAATGALGRLDKNSDGNLTFEELEPEFDDRGRGRDRGPEGRERGRDSEREGDERRRPDRGRRGPGGPPGMGPPPPGGPGGPGGMSRMLPVMAALDKDEDGELFDDEVTDAALSLLKLDKDGDGALSESELAPSFGRRGRGGPGGPGGRGRGGFGRGRGGPEREGGPVAPKDLERKDGVAEIKDQDTFREMSYQGDEVLIDTQLRGLEFVKFQIEAANTDAPKLYFINTNTHRAHMMFMDAAGIRQNWRSQMRGVLTYRPMLASPSGNVGHFTFEFEPNDAYEYDAIRVAFDLLGKHAPIVAGNLSYHLLPRAKEQYLTETEKYVEGKIPVFEEAKDEYARVAYLPLHEASSFGRLRLMKLDERPGPRDVVIYPTLPNEMPRVGGILTAVRQTPLSHVNLRAIQDDVPNAYVAGLLENPKIQALVGKYVAYSVRADGYELREATAEEVESHYAALRPAEAQQPTRDLSVREIRAFADLGFADAGTVGVKAANLAELRKLGFRADLTPDGYAVPFAFYDAFMKHNGFYAMAQKMIATADFKKSADTRESALKSFRKAMKKGEIPSWMNKALSDVQTKFPKGSTIRCRSSTNNEDLPGFNGAGLYDSYSHKPDEGHLSKSIKQVFASLWNFRAYEERDFYRIDHATTAMGVVLHLNTSEEKANGVAVTEDVLYGSAARGGAKFYVNAQLGEDLVTNPTSTAVPEELLLSPRNPRTDQIVRRSSRVEGDKSLLSDEHLLELRRALRKIDESFASLYGKSEDEPFAMEIEFKVTSDNKLFVKQARPWVF